MKCPFAVQKCFMDILIVEKEFGAKRKHRLSTRPDSKEKYTLNLEVPVMFPHYIESDCCPKCKKLIIDTADYENNLG